MAEAVLRDVLKGQADIVVESAGLGALAGHPASEHAVELMRDRGLDISGHRARQITPGMVASADLVLVMEVGHKRAIDMNDPAARGKIYRLCEWQDKDIKDPYRQPKEAFEAALADIDAGVAEWAKRISV
jgi:protein-tyrosine phosphatase